MRYFILFFLTALSQLSHAQIVACDDLWEGEPSDQNYYIGGRIDDVHVFRLFLCRHDNGLKGYYEMVSARVNVEVEGFLKGDSIFLAEYSPHQRVLGMIRGQLKDSTFTAGMTTPSGDFTGEMEGLSMKNWVFAKSPPEIHPTKTTLYTCPENPDESLLLFYPTVNSCRGIFYNRLMKKTFYLAGKKPDTHDKQYKLTTFTLPPSGTLMTCKLDENGFTQTILPSKVYNMKPSLSFHQNIIEKSNRYYSYEIYYPQIGPKDPSNRFNKIVQEVRHNFDSIYASLIQPGQEEQLHRRAGTLTAWFEPSYFSHKWLCGHFILQNNKTDSSQIIAVNYNYKKNKLLNFNDIIVSPPMEDNSWNDILGLNDTHYSFTSDDVYTSPALSYRGLLLSTPFDRLFDRKMYQTDKNIPKIRWKWWKPEFWEFKLQQL